MPKVAPSSHHGARVPPKALRASAGEPTNQRAAPAAAAAQVPFVVRFGILCALSLQTTAFVLLRRFSSHVRHDTFDKSSVMLVAELFKLGASLVGIFLGLEKDDQSRASELQSLAHNQGEADMAGVGRLVWKLVSTSGPMALQAVIYLVQNLLAFMALEFVDGGTYSVLMQGKVLATALFAIALVGSTVTSRQWKCLVVLVLGVVQITNEAKSGQQSLEDGARYAKGLVLTFLNVVLSGFSTAYMEKTFKDRGKDLSLWERNFQLAFCSVLVYSGILFSSHGLRFWDGWSPDASKRALVIAAVSSLGGILVALSLKYTDSILKSMASTIAIVMTTMVEWQFMGGPMSLHIVLGASFVLLGVSIYNEKS